MKRLILTLFVLFSHIISENLNTQKQWAKDYVSASKDSQINSILVKIIVYDYLFPGSVHGYLDWCTIECSSAGKAFFKLMDIHTQRQKWSRNTETIFRKKHKGSLTRFLDNVVYPNAGLMLKDFNSLKVIVTNYREYAKVTFESYFDCSHNISYLRVSGNWHVDDPGTSFIIDNLVYDINSSGQFKTNNMAVNTNVSIKDSVKVFNESEAIVIKGVDFGENIKFYTTTGVEVKSVISNNDIVKIKLPEKQIYIVHVRKSRYKVVL